MFTYLSIEDRVLEDVIEKALTSFGKREFVSHLISDFGLSIYQDYRILSLS